MFWCKKIRRDMDLIFSCNWNDWAIPLRVDWLYVTKRKIPELRTNLFVIGLQVLCFEIKVERRWLDS